MGRLIELAAGRWAHCSGALWLAAERVALVADAHLGYAWAQRRRGELGPLADGEMSEKLNALVDELSPRGVVFLGDVVHAPKPAAAERELIEGVLRSLARRVEVRMVRGNHDRAFARDFGGLGIAMEDEYRAEGLLALHGDRLPDDGRREGVHVVAGHFHPTVAIADAAGHKQRVRVFAMSDRATVLPAFSPFSTGLNLMRAWPAELEALLETKTRVRTVAVTGTRVKELPFRKR